MNTANIFISAMAISQFIFLAIHFGLQYRNQIGRLVAAFCVCAIAYLVHDSLSHGNSIWVHLTLEVLSALAPFLLWLVAYLLFVDDRRTPVIAILSITLCLVLEVAGELSFSIISWQQPSHLYDRLVSLLPQMILLVFSLHAIGLVARGYKADLLEERRKFRVAFIAGLSVVIAIIVSGNMLDNILSDGLPGSGDLYDILVSICLYSVILFFNLLSIQASKGANQLLALKPATSSSQDTVDQAPERRDQDARYVAMIEKAMSEEKLYEEPGLTLADLARHVGIMEYKARRIINQSMQYKNFNQFLNSYRINAACELIKTTHHPVSRIAMDVGYSSLSVFNRAFKDLMKQTPSEYRKAHQ